VNCTCMKGWSGDGQHCSYQTIPAGGIYCVLILKVSFEIFGYIDAAHQKILSACTTETRALANQISVINVQSFGTNATACSLLFTSQNNLSTIIPLPPAKTSNLTFSPCELLSNLEFAISNSSSLLAQWSPQPLANSTLSTNSDSPAPCVQQASQSSSSSSSSLSKGQVAGIVVGSVIGGLLVIAILITICFCFARGSSKSTAQAPQETTN